MSTMFESFRELDRIRQWRPSEPRVGARPTDAYGGGEARGDDPAGSPITLRRLCGRCRGSFTQDHALPPATLAEWWLCDPCRLALLGPFVSGATTP